MFYKALKEICSQIREVVWSGKQKDYFKKSSTLRTCISLGNVRKPSFVVMPISRTTKEIIITFEYKGISLQCVRCLEIIHDEAHAQIVKTKKK